VTTEVRENNQLVQIVSTSGLEKNKADYILEKFQGYFAIAAEWENRAKTLVVTSPEQTTLMKMAREGRLLLKSKRVDIEKARKELKEQSLREGKAIDGIANVLKALIEPTEEYLERQERFVEIQEEERLAERKATRMAEIMALGLFPDLYDLTNMPDAAYASLVQGTKDAIERQKEAELKAEADRKYREQEQERIRLENDRLKKEAEAKEKQMAAERAKAEAEEKRLRDEVLDREQKAAVAKAAAEAKIQHERDVAERAAARAKAEAVARERALKAEQQAKLKAEREAREREAAKVKAAADAKLQKEREEREKLAAQIKAQEQAKAKEEKRLADEEKKAARAPDKQKLLALADQLEDYVLPEMKSDDTKAIASNVSALLGKIVLFIRTKSKEL
jgi:hypothetical protein